MRKSTYQWDYLFVYTASLLWSISTFILPINSKDTVSPFVQFLWSGIAAVGSIIAIIGLIKQNNLLLERLGVSLIMANPIIFIALELALLIYDLLNPHQATGTWYNRLNVMFLGLWVVAFLNKRRRQLRHAVLEAKKTPLRSERIADK